MPVATLYRKIDPPVRGFSTTYLGGGSDEVPVGLAVDLAQRLRDRLQQLDQLPDHVRSVAPHAGRVGR